MRYPLDSISLEQRFGENQVDYSQFGLIGHHGLDFTAVIGTPVYAPEDGVIERSANGVNDKYTGRFAAGETITMVGSYEHWFMHLSRRLVQPGQRVSKGQLIGHTGNTGFSTGPHLHWGVRPLSPNINNGFRGFIDPVTVMQPNNQGVVMNQEAGTELYRTALFREPESAAAASQWNGQAPAHALRAVRGAEWQTVRSKVQAFDTLQQQVAELSTRPTKAELQNIVSTLTTERDKVASLEKQLAEEKAKPPVVKEVEKEVIKEVEKPTTWTKVKEFVLDQLYKLVVAITSKRSK